MNRRTGGALVLLAAIAGLAAVLGIAPGYVLSPSLPLDDAWAHAAHARSLATSGRFEPIPDSPGGGPASPLWAAVMAVPHLLAGQTAAIVLLVKLAGFALHALAALLLFSALTARRGVSPERLVGPLLVAFHPDLISASLSGVEAPLGTFVACALLWCVDRARAWPFMGLALAAPFVRPDLAVLALVLPAAMYARDRSRLWWLEAAGLAGTLAAFGLMAIGALPRSSIPARSALPGMREAEPVGFFGREVFGFTRLLDQLPVADAGILLLVGAAVAGYFALRDGDDGTGRASRRDARTMTAASGALLGGIAVWAVSFALLPPVAPLAFYAQRHALPALPLVVGALPILLYRGARRLLPPPAVAAVRVLVPLLLVASEAIDAPTRYRILANDAKNVDETHVAMAQALGPLAARRVVWAVDSPGALRYFGQSAVIDLSRTRDLDGDTTQALLHAHRPHFIEVVPGLSSIEGAAARALPALPFRTTTVDSADGTTEPRRERWLVACADPSAPDRVQVRGRTFDFRCGEGDLGISIARRNGAPGRP